MVFIILLICIANFVLLLYCLGAISEIQVRYPRTKIISSSDKVNTDDLDLLFEDEPKTKKPSKKAIKMPSDLKKRK